MMWVIEFKVDGEYWQEEDYCTEFLYAINVYFKIVKKWENNKEIKVRMVQVVLGSTEG